MEQQKLTLDNVTLYCVDCVAHEGAIISMNKTCENMEFARKIYFGDRKPKNWDESIEYVEIQKLNNLVEYSRFMLMDVPAHINTDFCLAVQEDGWVINTNNWRDEFLQYDYIGAPWTTTAQGKDDSWRVGNGGVSLRSKKLMDLIVKRDLSGWTGHEDTTIAHALRPYLEKNGCTLHH